MDQCQDEWTPRAKCLGQADLFELSDPPLDLELSEKPAREFTYWVNTNITKMKKAEQICLECPVFMACKESATLEDGEWTMRAAHWPNLLVKARMRPAHTCHTPSHQPRGEGERIKPYCPKCIRDEKRAKRRLPPTVGYMLN